MLGVFFLLVSHAVNNSTLPRSSTLDLENEHSEWMNLLSLSPVVFILALTFYLKNRLNVIISNLLPHRERMLENNEVV